MHAFALTSKYLATRSNLNRVEQLFPVARRVDFAPLTHEETAQAKTAWAYFETFTELKSGFCPISEGNRSLTPWEMGATLLAIIAAERLCLIAPTAATARLNHCLDALIDLPLANGRLPNARYNSRDLTIPRQRPQTSQRGVGWSPSRIMRLITSLLVTAHHHRDLVPVIDLILKRWSLTDMVGRGRFLASHPKSDGTFIPVPQGVLGYEQYAARAGLLINLPVQAARDMRPNLRGHWFDGILLPGDKRLIDGRAAVITPEPFCLEALDFGWDTDMLDVALTMYMAQKLRFEHTGILTALTEDALDQPPGFAFHGLLAGHQPFTSFSSSGRDISHLRCLSTKAAFCWWALLRTPYSQKLVDAVDPLKSPKGWFAGRYEATGHTNRIRSLNTNAVILEALHYKVFGPLCPRPKTAPLAALA